MVTMSRASAVGVVGLGNLGAAIVQNLVRRGWAVRVNDVNQQRMRSGIEAGATSATAAELAEASAICFAVPDDAAIRSVLDDGLLAALTPSHTVVVHSTIPPHRSAELAALIADHSGAHYVEAPVSGGADAAEKGSLTVFLGGDPSDIERLRPLLDDLSEVTFTLGGVGAAMATKLANQLIAFSALAGIYEALRITSAFGVDEADALAAIDRGTGSTWHGRNWGFWDRTAAFYDDAGVPTDDRPWSKDVAEVVTAARELALPAPVADFLVEALPAAVAAHADAAAGPERTR